MSSALGSWRPALRIARRDTARHKLATALAMALVALPVMAAVVVSTVKSSGESRSENGSYQRMGAADGELTVTRHAAITVRYSDGGSYLVARPAGGETPRRDPGRVDLESLLPADSRLVLGHAQNKEVRLATGGAVPVRVLDLDDPISRGLGELVSGSAPEAADEVAVPPAMADALGLLQSEGALRSDATLVAAGVPLRVVGLADIPDLHSVAIFVPPGSELVPGAGTRWVVDLPQLSTGELIALRANLAARGVAVLLRDASRSPEHWPELRADVAAEPADPTALAIGAMVVGLGAIEVVLLVGAALAVGARRQIRTLGLLASMGGSPRDVRRVFLARGLLVGGGGSLVGAAVGLGGLQLALPVWDGAHGGPLHVVDVVWANIGDGIPLYVLDVVWPYLAGIVGLGTLSGVLAAAYPAWVVGRMRVVDALAGRFPTGRHSVRLRPAAAGLVVAGVVGVLAAGSWIAAEYAPPAETARDRAYVEPSTLPLAAGGLAVLALLSGLVWLAPYLVQLAGAVSGRLGLAGRLAVRDAGRHRQRTAAAVVGLTATITGSVFAGFGLDAAVAADATAAPYAPRDTASIHRTPKDSLPGLNDTVDAAIGPSTVVDLREVVVPRGNGHLNLRIAGVRFAAGDVSVVGEDFLTLAGVDEAALAAYRDGTALVTRAGVVVDGRVELEAVQKLESVLTLQVLATAVTTAWNDWFTGAVWISPQTAERLGARVQGSTVLVHKPGGFDRDDAETLEALGIDSEISMLTTGYEVGLLRFAVVGGGALVTALAVGILVSLAAAESRADAATLAAVGAPPGSRRLMGAVHGLFVGVLGGGLGLVVGTAAGTSLLQAVGTPGVPVPWLTLLAIVASVPALSAAVGWVATPSRVSLVRRLD